MGEWVCLVHRVGVSYIWRVPTVLREHGFRVGFFSYDLGEAARVHVTKAGCEAKFWLGPVRLAWNRRFREHELREIAGILIANEQLILEKWRERLGR